MEPRLASTPVYPLFSLFHPQPTVYLRFIWFNFHIYSFYVILGISIEVQMRVIASEDYLRISYFSMF